MPGDENDLSGKIGLDVTAFKQGISELNQQIKNIEVGFRGSAGSMEDWAGTTDGLKTRISTLNDRLGLQRTKLKALTDEFKFLSTAEGDHSKDMESLAAQMSTLEKQIGGTKNELNRYNGELDDLGKGSDEAGSDVEKAGKKAKQSGDDAGNGASGWSKLGSGIGAAAKSAGIAVGVLSAAAAGAAVKLGKEVVESYGELEQNLGGSEAVFGEYAASIQKTGEDAYKNLGVSQSEYLASANKMGALFQGAGLSQQESLDLTEKAMQRATDAASVMGIDTSMALEAVTGAAKGNYTMMDNLGVAMNETSLKAYALSKGLDYGEISADQSKKAELAMQYFFEKTEQYAGNFEKEATQSISGSMGMMSASWESLFAGFGNSDADIGNLTQNLTDAIDAVIKNITPVIDNIVQAIPQVFDALIPAISGLLPQLLTTAASLFNSILSALIALLPMLMPVVADAMLMIANTLVENLPLLISAAMTLIVTLAQGIADALPELIPTIVDTVLMIVDTLISNVDLLIEAAVAIMVGLTTGLINALPRLIEKAPQIIISLVAAIVKSVPKLLGATTQIIATLVKGLATLPAQMMTAGGNLITGLWNGMGNKLKWLKDKIKGFTDSVISNIKAFFGVHSPSTVFAGIGGYLSEGLANGITDKAGLVKSAMNKLNSQIQGSATINANVSGSGGSGGAFGLATTNLYLDGKKVASATSPVQYSSNNTKSRSLGVALA